MIVVGPGRPFDLFIDEEVLEATPGGLPDALREVYLGDWVIPQTDRPYCYSNFVMSHDGRVSFAVPGHEGGGDVSDFNPHDQWLMGLLRARADAVMVGANTLRSESEHVWTPGFIFPADAEAFAELRHLEGRQTHPLQVFVTRSGDITPAAEVFHRPELTCIVITTEDGEQTVRDRTIPNLEVVVAGETDVNFDEALTALHDRWGVQTVLCEGGPRLYGAAIEAGVIDEEFLTLSPVLVGADDGSPRPGLIEGFALSPGASNRARLVSVRRASDHLFLRTRITS